MNQKSSPIKLTISLKEQKVEKKEKEALMVTKRTLVFQLNRSIKKWSLKDDIVRLMDVEI